VNNLNDEQASVRGGLKLSDQSMMELQSRMPGHDDFDRMSYMSRGSIKST